MKQQPDIITGNTADEVWRSCASHLLAEGDRLNLVVHIKHPENIDRDQLKELDPRRVDSVVMSVFDVATTIFPHPGPRWQLNAAQFVEHYLPAYARLKRRNRSGWGFYFQRLASFGQSAAPQLVRIVDGLKGWGHGHHGAFAIHISSAEVDKPRPQGGPCWQYGQLMADGDRLSLAAVYRSHDYFHKALGNFVGLSRLLSYVCSKTGHEVGTLTCHSTYAFLGTKRGATAKLLNGE
jgi:hypothetical protein